MKQTEETTQSGPPVDTVVALAALYRAPDVFGAIVTEHAGADGRTVLLGYVTGPDPALGTGQIRRHLANQLPNHLIPEHVFILDELPLTHDGAYDVDALPLPSEEGAAADGYVAPRNQLESQLVDLMQEILGVEGVGVYDGFFALGGSSIMATRLASRIREKFDVDIALPDVLASPTVEELAVLVGGARKV